ncbi:PTS sugar transporter subunit IIA [Streptomyces sparsogenes]|uniref:PTS sugar transporter subunit IIA n=1 Tax=Streptomyces sparsogenes TaxID=67365 RepID=UPI0033D67C8E
MTQLSDLLPGEAIRLDVRAADWREAIGVAGGLMVAAGVATEDYTAEMIANVEDNGPYIVIAPGLAFAHARPSPAVLRTGMSWVRLAEPVEFGHESNDPVELVVALAAKDSAAHTSAMAALARLLGDPDTAAALAAAPTPEALLAILTGDAEPGPAAAPAPAPAAESAPAAGSASSASSAAPASSPHKILTVCGNGVGTSLFLKNTLEQVLDRWKWSKFVTVEATDTISAKGKASEAVALLTSREIARTLGDVGRPVKVVQDFTSTAEVDAALRDIYDVDTPDADTRATGTPDAGTPDA